MARPTRRNIASGIAAWEADVDSNFGLVFDAPFPIAAYATEGDLPSASSYDNCLALVEADSRLYISDGSTWGLYDSRSVNVPQSTATTVADMASDFNDLLIALRNAGIMEVS